MEDFLAELAQLPERPLLVRGRCSERLAGAEAYLPVLEALDSLLHQSSSGSVPSLIKSVAPTWYVQVAHAESSQASVARVREDAPAVSQERMKRELGALLLEVSRLRPLVLFLDDLHWADVSTIDMLNYLAGRFDQMRLLDPGDLPARGHDARPASVPRHPRRAERARRARRRSRSASSSAATSSATSP